MGKKYNKVRMIPEQNQRICRSICVCQFTMVMSCVALVYLTVAIYMPSHRAFRSGVDPVPVTCQTTSTVMASNCQWASCGEWCLTKTSGFCPQINVTVRRNGTDALLSGCTAVERHVCPPVDLDTLPKYNCNNGSECERLSGVFRCKLGHCHNMSAALQCQVRADGPQFNSERDNVKLTGVFLCKRGNCTKVKHYKCDRYCEEIDAEDKTVFVVHGNDVVSAICDRAEALQEANGTDPGRPINATEFWPTLPLDEESEMEDDVGTTDTPPGDSSPQNTALAVPPIKVPENAQTIKVQAGPTDALVITCREVTIQEDVISCVDCVNGSLIARNGPDLQNRTSFNFTTFRSVYARAQERPADFRMRYAPPQNVLTIYPNSRLQINLEACVNTLQDECKVFVETHGNDGRNDTAQSQFPCYFDKSNSFFVVARFDLEKTLRDLVVAVAVPSALFVLSWASLCAITRSVRVGDDARMRCQYCAGGADPDDCTMAPGARDRDRARAHGGGKGAGDTSDDELADRPCGGGSGAELAATPARAPGDDDEETELVLAAPTSTHRYLEGRDNRALSLAA